jgi:hypothetical protein
MLYRRDKSGRVEGHIVEVHVSCWDEGRRRAAAQGMLWWESTDPRTPRSGDFPAASEGTPSPSRPEGSSRSLSGRMRPTTGWSVLQELDPEWLYVKLESEGDLLGDSWVRIEPNEDELRLIEGVCSHLPDDLQPAGHAFECWRDHHDRLVVSWRPDAESLTLVPVTNSDDSHIRHEYGDARLVAHLCVQTSVRRAWATLWSDGAPVRLPAWFGSGQPDDRRA